MKTKLIYLRYIAKVDEDNFTVVDKFIVVDDKFIVDDD